MIGVIMAGFLYGNIVDTINHYKFDIVLKSPYTPNLPAAVQRGEVEPIFDDIHSVGTTRLSLRYVIDMIFKDVNFVILQPETNISLMIDFLGQFLTYMAGFQNLDATNKEFVNRAATARNTLLPMEKVFKHRHKVQNPDRKKSFEDLLEEATK